jgi:hypothetical protein
MQMSGQMLQEEGHALVSDRLFYHLIIVQYEDDGSRMRLLAFQLMEKYGKPGGKRRWLGRLQLCHHGFPKVRCQTGAAAQGREQRDEVLWTPDLPCVCLVPNGASIPPNTKKYTIAEAHRQGRLPELSRTQRGHEE